MAFGRMWTQQEPQSLIYDEYPPPDYQLWLEPSPRKPALRMCEFKVGTAERKQGNQRLWARRWRSACNCRFFSLCVCLMSHVCVGMISRVSVVPQQGFTRGCHPCSQAAAAPAGTAEAVGLLSEIRSWWNPRMAMRRCELTHNTMKQHIDTILIITQTLLCGSSSQVLWCVSVDCLALAEVCVLSSCFLIVHRSSVPRCLIMSATSAIFDNQNVQQDTKPYLQTC